MPEETWEIPACSGDTGLAPVDPPRGATKMRQGKGRKMDTQTLTLAERARALHERALVWDNHACLPLRAEDDFLPELQRFRRAGVNAVSVNVGFGDMDWRQNLPIFAHFRAWLARRPEDYLLVREVADIDRAKETGRLAVMFDLEGMDAIGDDLNLIQLYYDLGVRWMLVAYNKANRAGSGCQDAEDRGLTAFGRKAIDEMARVGMVLCLSHTGHRTAREALEYSTNPVIFSHSNPRGLHEHERNIPDDLMAACAATGGVVGINGIGLFLGPGNRADAELIVRHIDHAVERIGVPHVGISLDYVFDDAELAAYIAANPDKFPPHLGYGAGMAMAGPERFPEITEGLLRLGYDDASVMAILGGNWRRVAEAVWK